MVFVFNSKNFLLLSLFLSSLSYSYNLNDFQDWFKDKKIDNETINSSLINQNLINDSQRGIESFFTEKKMGNKISLSRAVRLALDKSPLLKRLYSLMEAEIENENVAKSGYMPKISAGIDFSSSNVEKISGIDSVSQRFYVSVSQLLYDFGKTSASIQKGRSNVLLKKAEFLKQLDSVALQTAVAVLEVDRYTELFEVSQMQLDAVKDIYKMTLDRSNVGVSSQSDPVQAKARLDSMRSYSLEVDAARKRAIEHLRTLTGYIVSDIYLPEIDSIKLPLNNLLNFDQQKIPDILIARAYQQVALYDVEHSESSIYPSISLEMRSSKDFNVNYPRTLNPSGANTSLNIGVSASLYEGRSGIAKIRAAKREIEAANEKINESIQNTSDTLRSYRENILSFQGRLKVSQDRVNSLNEARRLFKEQYMLGSRSILDLLSTEQDYFQSLSDNVNLYHELYITKLSFIEARGLTRVFYNINNTKVQGMVILP